MENFESILYAIQSGLREILVKNECYMLSWDMSEIKEIGEDLISLADRTYQQLIRVEHRILYLSIREAGLGIRKRVNDLRRRPIGEKDQEYFRSVHEALSNICMKIENGEYYEALREVASRREEEIYSLAR